MKKAFFYAMKGVKNEENNTHKWNAKKQKKRERERGGSTTTYPLCQRHGQNGHSGKKGLKPA